MNAFATSLPALRGGLLALLAATLFGASTPLVQRFEAGVGAFTTAVMLATAAWGLDNGLSRALAERDPGQVVMAKGLLGASATLLLAWLFDEPLPPVQAIAGLAIVGATGYGFSLRLYLLAQRAPGRCSPSRRSSARHSRSDWAITPSADSPPSARH